MRDVKIYSAGVARASGYGAWASSLHASPMLRELSGVLVKTTANRAELTALVSAFDALVNPGLIEVWTESRYVINGSSLLDHWALGNWQKPDDNKDLWQAIWQYHQEYRISFKYLNYGGHAESRRLRALAELHAKTAESRQMAEADTEQLLLNTLRNSRR